MAFDWSDYFIIAEDLQAETAGKTASNKNEALQRTAIGRAYYSMYHLAEDYAKANLSYDPKKVGANSYHSEVRLVYQKQLGNPDHQEIKGLLFQMHKARLDSDYDASNIGNIQSLLASVMIAARKVQGILIK